jgi:uncharacterized caspase-like protein
MPRVVVAFACSWMEKQHMKTTSLPGRTTVAMLAVAVVSALGTIGWSASAAPQAQTAFLPLSISINALMVGMVDDVAHDIWEGGNKSATLTGREWQVISEHAIQLQAAATLVSLGGTGQADKGWVASAAWQDWSRKLKDAGVSVKRAVDTKNQMALRTAGDALVDTCEGCHKQFKPDLPTEGILHIPHGKDSF